MAFDRLFCPIKSSKSKKSSHQNNRSTESTPNTSNNSTNNGNNQHHNNNTTNRINQDHVGPQATSMPYRYVTNEFKAEAVDELTVFPGDLVLYEFTDSTTGRDWSHVLCFKTNKRGFVPSEILSRDPRKASQCKKKLPRSLPDSIGHSHVAYPAGPQPLVDENMRFQPNPMRETQPKFNIDQSLQGSLHYPDLGHFRHPLSPPAYYNIRTTGPHYERYEVHCRPFHRDPLGSLYMVLNKFVARGESEIDVEWRDLVTVLNKEDEDWYWVKRGDGVEGFIPAKFVCDYKLIESILSKGNSTVTMKSSNQNDIHTHHTYINQHPGSPTDQQSSVMQHI